MSRNGLTGRLTKRGALGLALLLLGVQVVRPAKSNPAVELNRTIESHTQVPPEISEVFRRACDDCHSNKTVWPWYSNVAPVSWFVIDHVNHGRRHLNFSDWASYDSEQADDLLGNIAKEVRGGSMPLTSYTLLHPEAKLSREERSMIIDWAQAERVRLAYRRR
jgi:hypothetical protein